MAKSGILAKSQDLQESFGATTGAITIGIDLGDRFSYLLSSSEGFQCVGGDGSSEAQILQCTG